MHTLAVALLIAIVASAPAGAEPPPTAQESPAPAVEGLVWIALRDNPDLAAARAGAEAARARPGLARTLPDPVFTYGWMGEHIVTARGPQSSNFKVTQEFPFFGKRGLAGETAEHAARMSEEQVRALELEVAADVRRTAAELIYLDEAIGITRTDGNLLKEIRDIARVRYETGVGRLEDVARAEVERAESERRILDLEREREVTRAEMNRLLGRPAASALPPFAADLDPERIPHPTRSTADRMDQDPAMADSLAAIRPEVLAAEESIRASESMRDLAGRAYWPDFMLGFQYFVIDKGDSPSPEAGTDAWMVEVGVSVPLWLGARRSGVSEAEAVRQEGLAARSAALNRAQYEITAAAARVRRTGDIADLYDSTIIPQADLALASARDSYQAGRANFIDLLDAERALTSARLAEARARADLMQGIADLARATAAPLPDAAGETP